jgi:hypothetical protein
MMFSLFGSRLQDCTNISSHVKVYNIAALNANGLTQSIKEVEVFLNTQKIDILLLPESHFTEHNYVNIQN